MEQLTLLLVAMIVPFALALCYMAPAAVALKRRHPKKDTIRAVNLFLGWTVIGWLVTLVWSFGTPDAAEATPLGFARPVEPHINIAPNAMNEIRTEVMGLSRHDLPVRDLLPGQNLRLIRGREKDAGPSAVKVCLRDGREIGVLSQEVSARIAMNLDGNRQVDCRVLSVTGGDGRSYRVAVMLAIHLLRSPSAARTPPAGGHLPAVGSG